MARRTCMQCPCCVRLDPGGNATGGAAQCGRQSLCGTADNVVQLEVANAAVARVTRGSAASQEGLARANAAVVGDVVCAACVGSQPYVIGRVVAAAVEAKAAARAVTGQVKAGDVVLELQRFVVVAAEISGMTLEVAEGEGSRVLVHGEKVRLGKMEHSIELVREKNRAALVSFYQRHNSEKLSEKEEDGTPVIDTILSKASTYTKATAEAYKQKYDAAPELTEPTGDMVTLTAEQARAVWACVAQ